ncbi:MAG TPA: hypothetical protein PK402_01080, partial [Tepidisphaeraceae bacterium]|nr:hypothetical protein [Tepidisphaeraceae bacterium]
MKRLFAALAFLMAFTFVGARGQNATDEKTRWQSDVEQFAATITAGAPIGDCAVVASDATLRTFGQTQPGPIAQLSNLTKQSRLVSARSGTNPMISLASDLALDAKSIELDS